MFLQQSLTYHRAGNMPKACRYAMALSFLVIWHKPNTKLVIQSYLFFSTPPISPTIFPHNKHTKLPFTPKSPPPTPPSHAQIRYRSLHQNVGTCLRRKHWKTIKIENEVKVLWRLVAVGNGSKSLLSTFSVLSPSACFKRNRQNAKALPRTVKALYQYHFCNFTPHYPTSKKIGGNRILMD